MRKRFPRASKFTKASKLAQAGESSRQAIARELFEETGIRADADEFQFIGSNTERNTHYDYYYILLQSAVEEIVLLPGETDDVRWATFREVQQLVDEKKICKVIARQFGWQKELLPGWQNTQN